MAISLTLYRTAVATHLDLWQTLRYHPDWGAWLAVSTRAVGGQPRTQPAVVKGS